MLIVYSRLAPQINEQKVGDGVHIGTGIQVDKTASMLAQRRAPYIVIALPSIHPPAHRKSVLFLLVPWIQDFQFVAVDLRIEVRCTGDTRAALSHFKGFSEEVINKYRTSVNAYAEDLSSDGTVGSKALQMIMHCVEELSRINDETASSAAECIICSGEIEPHDLRDRQARKCVVIQGCLHRFHRECIQ